VTFRRPDLDWSVYRKNNKNAQEACATRYSQSPSNIAERRNSQNFIEPERSTTTMIKSVSFEKKQLYLQTNPDDQDRASRLVGSSLLDSNDN